jgi:hypothetical protein
MYIRIRMQPMKIKITHFLLGLIAQKKKKLTLLNIVLHSAVSINLLKPNGYVCNFNILILCITPTKCICKFDMILTINSCCFPK